MSESWGEGLFLEFYGTMNDCAKPEMTCTFVSCFIMFVVFPPLLTFILRFRSISRYFCTL